MPSPTDAPVSLPERLADAEGELPADIVEAINALAYAARAFYCAPEAWEVVQARAALTATILARLTAAESAREVLKAEIRDQAMKQLASDAGWELDWDKVRAERDAALARAERTEKALEPFAEAADNLELLAKQDGSPPAVYKAVFWHSALVAARAALAPPATAEET